MKKLVFILIFTLVTIVGKAQGGGDYANPRFIFGKPFIENFQTMYNRAQFDMMVQFTSSMTLKRFGEANVRDYYENYIKFSYPLEFRKVSVSPDGIYNFYYFVKTDYTEKRAVTFHIIIENDTSKIVLDNLRFNFVDLRNIENK